MKKVFAIFAIATLVACGGASTEATTDSTATGVDSSAVIVNDTTVKGGGGEVAEPTISDRAEKPVSNEEIK
jgi:hypothetical protein